MSKKSNKWPFSVLVDMKKIKLKDKVKGLKGWKLTYLFVIIFFIALGGIYAIYQHPGFNSVEEPHFERTVSKESNASRVEIIEVKDDLDKYRLKRQELTLAQKYQEVNADEEVASLKVSARATNEDDFNNLARPVAGEIVSSWHEPYKDRVLDAWKFNGGIDIKASIGTKVKVVQDGIIEEIIKDDYQGITVIIKHNNKFKTLYSNIQNTHLEEGEKISKGQTLGEVGDSGLNDDSKLHFEVIKFENGEEQRISPLHFLK